MILIICILVVGLAASILMNLYHAIPYFKRPKCPNDYRCADCVHGVAHWDGIIFRGFSCRKNAR